MYNHQNNNDNQGQRRGTGKSKGSVLRILLVSMLGFGVFIGLIFPPFAKVVLDAPNALSLRFMVMCITAGVLVGVVNFLLFKVFVSRELEYLVRGMELVNKKIGEGISGGVYQDGETRLDVRSEDIIGDVVLAFNAMSKTIVDRFNQDQTIRDLMSRLANSVDLRDCSRTILQGFVEATGAYGGALYARVDQKLELQVVEGIDYPGRLPEEVDESDGAVGKAVGSGRVVDISPGRESLEWVDISTPLGLLQPESIKIIPLCIEKNAIGLLVLVPGKEMDKEAVRRVEDLRSSLTPYLENVILYQKIKTLAVVDSLTGSYNRRFGEQRLEEAFSSCLRKNLPLNVLMLDIDHFKQINDSYGHAVGDIVLKKLAEYLDGNLRKEEIVCRYGGEEFLVIMPNTEVEEAIKLACRLRRGVEAFAIQWRDSELKVTASMGVANWPAVQTASSDTLLRAADDALYFAKEKGRNVVAFHEGEQGEIKLVREDEIQ